MSNPFEVIKWARGQDLPQAQKLILLILTTYADKNTHDCHPGQNLLAKDAGMSVRSVRNAVKALEDSGLVRRKARFLENGNRTSDTYVLNFGYSPTKSPPADVAAGEHSPPANPARPPADFDTHHRQNLPGNRPEELPEEHLGAIAPAPEDDDVIQGELVPAGEPTPTAQTLVGEWLNNMGTRPPQRVIGHLSREIKTLLDEGYDYGLVRAAVIRWSSKGLHPSTLASVLHEIQTKQAQPMGGPDNRINETLAAGQRLQAMLNERKAS